MNNTRLQSESVELDSVQGTPLLHELRVPVRESTKWLNSNFEEVRATLETNGALLLRGAHINGSRKLEKVLKSIFDDELLDYTYRSTPRTKMRGRIFTSTEYHANETIALHNENAYSNSWPMRIAFYCVQPSENGGQTPIVDSRKVYQSIPADIRKEFEQRDLCYVRNYGEVDLPWTEVFQTQSKNEVEHYCETSGIEYQWVGKTGLSTRQYGQSSCLHPTTAEPLWFNQAHIFHLSNHSESVRQNMLSVFGRKNLPRNVYFGDGGDISDEHFKPIRDALEKNKITFKWQAGDLLLLDNMLFAHGRQPFTGSRRILTGMSSPMNNKNINLYSTQSVVSL